MIIKKYVKNGEVICTSIAGTTPEEWKWLREHPLSPGHGGSSDPKIIEKTERQIRELFPVRERIIPQK